jgi:hypothetical protein
LETRLTSSGFGIAIEGVLAGALKDQTHDLVVPSASGLGAGDGQSVLNCSHVQHLASQPCSRRSSTGFTNEDGRLKQVFSSSKEEFPSLVIVLITSVVAFRA